MSKPLDPNSKSGFIRANLDKPTAEIIALGAAKGMKISHGLIGMVRRSASGGQTARRKMKKVKASALRKTPKTKRKYTRRLPQIVASNGKTPVSVSALVERFKADLAAINQQTLKDALEGLL